MKGDGKMEQRKRVPRRGCSRRLSRD